MLNLLNKNISYLIVSSENQNLSKEENKINDDRICNILYSKEYKLVPVKGYYNNNYENSYIAIPSNPDNDTIRIDSIFLLDEFNQESIIVKYEGEEIAKKIEKNGSEKVMDLVLYNSDMSNRTYIYSGLSFSFVETKRHYYPKSKKDLKKGMIVEFNNNGEWKKRTINNIDVEYENMYKLLIKYKKLRIEY